MKTKFIFTTAVMVLALALMTSQARAVMVGKFTQAMLLPFLYQDMATGEKTVVGLDIHYPLADPANSDVRSAGAPAKVTWWVHDANGVLLGSYTWTDPNVVAGQPRDDVYLPVDFGLNYTGTGYVVFAVDMDNNGDVYGASKATISGNAFYARPANGDAVYVPVIQLYVTDVAAQGQPRSIMGGIHAAAGKTVVMKFWQDSSAGADTKGVIFSTGAIPQTGLLYTASADGTNVAINNSAIKGRMAFFDFGKDMTPAIPDQTDGFVRMDLSQASGDIVMFTMTNSTALNATQTLLGMEER